MLLISDHFLTVAHLFTHEYFTVKNILQLKGAGRVFLSLVDNLSVDHSLCVCVGFLEMLKIGCLLCSYVCDLSHEVRCGIFWCSKGFRF